MLKDKLYELAEDILKVSRAEETVVLAHGESSHVVRFANSIIHQNTEVKSISLTVHVRFGKKAATFKTNTINSPQDIVMAVRRAEELAKISPENDDLPRIPPEGKLETSPDSFDELTAEADPEHLVNIAHELIEGTRSITFNGKQFAAFGLISGGSAESVLMSSEGFVGYRGVTAAHLKYNPIYDLTFGYLVQQSGRTFRDLNVDAALEKARKRAPLVLDPLDAKPGPWTVILEPLAVAELLDFLNWIGLSARSVQEGRSPLAGKLGQKLFSDLFTLYEDPLNPRGYPTPFDMEGNRRGLITVIENGVLKDFAYDTPTARKENKESNGCAFSFATSQPFFSNLRIKEGNEDYDDILNNTEKALLVTRFWYSNVVDPRTLTVTGMTRDGLFVVENGRLTRSMKNMRFNVSLLDVFSNISAVSKESHLVGDPTWYGEFQVRGHILPTLLVENFNFASATQF
ncbi:MAG: TldD/PmbA family protein [Thermotogae bacterium]|nr:TldD/PmbA family protein [Thermotogota bacterium]